MRCAKICIAANKFAQQKTAESAESTINHQRFAVLHISSSISHGMERTLECVSHDAELAKHL